MVHISVDVPPEVAEWFASNPGVATSVLSVFASQRLAETTLPQRQEFRSKVLQRLTALPDPEVAEQFEAWRVDFLARNEIRPVRLPGDPTE
jgi:hypothetical protein